MSEIEKKKTEQLKNQLQEKIKEVQSKLGKLRAQLSTNLAAKREQIKKGYESYIKEFKNNYSEYIKKKDKEREKEKYDKDFLSLEYLNEMKKIKILEKFNKNLSDIVICSLDNYNNFLLYNLPYYKELAFNFLINQQEKLSNNNIFAKINEKQINQIYENLKNKNLFHYINGKYPIDIKITSSNDTFVEDKCLLDSTSLLKINSINLNYLNDENFKEFFNNSDYEFDNNIRKTKEIIFQNCNFRNIDISVIPYNFQNFKIINSRITSTIFDKIQFQNLISINIDNNKLDSDNFESIFKILLQENNISKKLKFFSAKNNNISRIIKDNELNRINNEFKSLEYIDLSNNNIADVNKNLFEKIPKIKILDLSNNSLSQSKKIKELIDNCKGIIVLANNIGVMQISENDSYLDYYIKKLNNNEYPIQSFNLDSLLFKRNIDKFLKNDFSLIKRNFNILELNFSSCNLNDQNSIKIISNCSILNSNISKINLSLNLITENIYDLLINNNINKLLYKLTELDLSYNSIKIIKLKKYNKNWQAHENLLTKFISHFPQLELLILKGTPCEDKFNEYVKKEVTAYMEKVKKGKISDKSKNELKELTEIRDIFEKKYLQVNPNFHLKINDFITIKYVKRMKQVDYIDLNNIIFDNVRPEENKQY